MNVEVYKNATIIYYDEVSSRRGDITVFSEKGENLMLNIENLSSNEPENACVRDVIVDCPIILNISNISEN